MKLYILNCLLLCIVACDGNVREKNGPAFLVKYSKQFVMYDGNHADGFYNDHDSFIEPYVGVTYNGDTMIATTLHEINQCAEVGARIRLSGDTVFLLTEWLGEEGCASIMFSKFTYWILLSDSIELKIVY